MGTIKIGQYQTRALRRKVAKNDIKNEFAATYRNKKLMLLSKKLCEVAHLGDLASADACRQMKSEANRDKNRHPDSFLDLYLMQKDKKW